MMTSAVGGRQEIHNTTASRLSSRRTSQSGRATNQSALRVVHLAVDKLMKFSNSCMPAYVGECNANVLLKMGNLSNFVFALAQPAM